MALYALMDEAGNLLEVSLDRREIPGWRLLDSDEEYEIRCADRTRRMTGMAPLIPLEENGKKFSDKAKQSKEGSMPLKQLWLQQARCYNGNYKICEPIY